MKNPKKSQEKLFPSFLLMFVFLFAFTSCETVKDDDEKPEMIEVKGEMHATTTSPPHVPRPVGNRAATKLIVEMEVVEKEMELTDGTSYIYWTFDGTVPGSFIRTRVGDEVEFHLKNHPNNKLPHNIDLHAVSGPGGGAEASFIAPGQQVTFTFKAINPGLFVYHCATAPVGMHVANGMYGLILVEPEGGLPPVDKEFYVMQGEFYTDGDTGAPGLQAFSMEKAVEEDADYVVFNGHMNSLTGENAISAEVGETVRIFMGNGGPNLVSSFHVIGEIFDRVRFEGGSMVNENVSTTLIPAGGAAIVEFKVDVPGDFVLVDHSLFRAFNKGALGILKVEGEENPNIFGGRVEEGIYQPETKSTIDGPDGDAEAPIDITSLETKLERGKNVYTQNCLACHQSAGTGIPGAFPPLAGSDFLNADVTRAIGIVKHGLSGEITVNGNVYNSVMPPQMLSADDIASVLTYVYNNWGNNGTEVTAEMVKAVK